MDSIRITITRGCNADGTGGAVVDDAAGVLGALPDGTPILDVACDAFADAYGIYEIPAPTAENPNATVKATPYRNLSYRLRMFATEIVSAFAARQAAASAYAAAAQQTDAAISGIAVIEFTSANQELA